MSPSRSALLLLLTFPVLTGCGGGGDSYSSYCTEVKAQQKPITEAVTGESNGGLLVALPYFEKLQAKAPADISGDWAIVVRRLELLQKALDDAGADPDTYDPAHPPASLSTDDTAAIAAAATALDSAETKAAFTAVQQEARDVCGTPLSL